MKAARLLALSLPCLLCNSALRMVIRFFCKKFRSSAIDCFSLSVDLSVYLADTNGVLGGPAVLCVWGRLGVSLLYLAKSLRGIADDDGGQCYESAVDFSLGGIMLETSWSTCSHSLYLSSWRPLNLLLWN